MPRSATCLRSDECHYLTYRQYCDGCKAYREQNDATREVGLTCERCHHPVAWHNQAQCSGCHICDGRGAEIQNDATRETGSTITVSLSVGDIELSDDMLALLRPNS